MQTFSMFANFFSMFQNPYSDLRKLQSSSQKRFPNTGSEAAAALEIKTDFISDTGSLLWIKESVACSPSCWLHTLIKWDGQHGPTNRTAGCQMDVDALSGLRSASTLYSLMYIYGHYVWEEGRVETELPSRLRVGGCVCRKSTAGVSLCMLFPGIQYINVQKTTTLHTFSHVWHTKVLHWGSAIIYQGVLLYVVIISICTFVVGIAHSED